MEYLLLVSYEDEDNPFNPLETSIVNDWEKSFCEPNDEYDSTY